MRYSIFLSLSIIFLGLCIFPASFRRVCIFTISSKQSNQRYYSHFACLYTANSIGGSSNDDCTHSNNKNLNSCIFSLVSFISLKAIERKANVDVFCFVFDWNTHWKRMNVQTNERKNGATDNVRVKERERERSRAPTANWTPKMSYKRDSESMKRCCVMKCLNVQRGNNNNNNIVVAPIAADDVQWICLILIANSEQFWWLFQRQSFDLFFAAFVFVIPCRWNHISALWRSVKM